MKDKNKLKVLEKHPNATCKRVKGLDRLGRKSDNWLFTIEIGFYSYISDWKCTLAEAWADAALKLDN